MSTFEFSKDVDDIEEPLLLPEDWYTVQIFKEPEILPNNKMKVDPEQEGAGHNLVVKLKTTDQEPEFNGRVLTVWLPWPGPNDEEIYTGKGQKQSDAKMERVVEFALAFGGEVDGKKISLATGLEGSCYIVQGLDQAGKDVINSIDTFSGFRSID